MNPITVRTIGLAVMSALAAVFVQVYGVMQANWLKFGLKLDLTCLPVPTVIFCKYAFLGYILPIASLCAFFFKDTAPDKTSALADAFLWLVAILTAAWLFASILAWRLPLYYPVAEIR